MRQTQSLRPSMTTPNPLRGWDIGLAAFALACMTAGFWRLWPGALSLADAPLGPMILKAGLASLGFVALATRWEDALRALARNPLMLVMLALTVSSALWAIVPADALRNAIMLIVIWVFGVGLTLRFQARDLAEICAFGGMFGLMAQFAAHQNMPPITAFDGDIAFAIIATGWAALSVPARRSLWGLAFGACGLLAFAAGDLASLGAVIGLVLGIGVAQLGTIRGRQGTISIIVTAWILVALIIGVTVFALFGADPVSARLSSFFSQLGANMVIGQGFATSGQSVSSGLAAGLGVLGLALGALVAFATLFQVLLGERQDPNGVNFTIAIWFATLGTILVAPGEIALFGPVCILFAASAFSISLSNVPMPRSRKKLMDHPSGSKRLSDPQTGLKQPIRSGFIPRDISLHSKR